MNNMADLVQVRGNKMTNFVKVRGAGVKMRDFVRVRGQEDTIFQGIRRRNSLWELTNNSYVSK